MLRAVDDKFPKIYGVQIYGVRATVAKAASLL